MAFPLGQFTFPGLEHNSGGVFTISRGIHPSAAILFLPPTYQFQPKEGDLTLLYGEKRPIRWRNCTIDTAHLSRRHGGLIWNVRILDRRWKWTVGGYVEGEYNRRNPDGTIIESTRKSLSELADICLEALADPSYDTSAMPRIYPEVNWNDEREIVGAAFALEQLCEDARCVICLGNDNVIRCFPEGQGDRLPTDVTTSHQSYSLDAPEIPDSIKCFGSPTLWQFRWSLEPVGQDTDGAIKPIYDLSYMPSTGWHREVPGEFVSLSGNTEALELAKRTVFRWYRILGMAMESCEGGSGFQDPRDQVCEVYDSTSPTGYLTARQNVASLDLPEYGEIDSISQVLPLKPHTVEVYDDSAAGSKRFKPPVVMGIYFDGEGGGANTFKADVVNLPWSLHEDLGVVAFREPIFQIQQDQYWPAELTLDIACTIKTNETNIWDRYTLELPTGQRNNTGPETIIRPEIRKTVRTLYENPFRTFEPTGKITNEDAGTDQDTDLELQARLWIDARMAAYENREQQDVTYPGLVDIACDGAISQVTYQVAIAGENPGTTTRASRNATHSVYVRNRK